MDGDFELLFDGEMSWSDYGKLKWAVYDIDFCCKWSEMEKELCALDYVIGC